MQKLHHHEVKRIFAIKRVVVVVVVVFFSFSLWLNSENVVYNPL